MFIELIEVLRCPQPHEESWLVAAFAKAEGRVILEGRLGCPVCGREYRIAAGIARFDEAANAPVRTSIVAYDHWRVAALLDLQTPEALVVLYGETGSAAAALCELLPVRVLAINPSGEQAPRERLGVARTENSIPVRASTAAGVALDRVEPALIADAARALRPGGRLLAPVGVEVPAGFSVIARDEHEFVAVKEIAAAGVQLSRR